MLGIVFKALVFLLIQLPWMLLVGAIKLLALPFQLLALLAKLVGMVKYVVVGAVLVAVAKRALAALESRGERVPA